MEKSQNLSSSQLYIITMEPLISIMKKEKKKRYTMKFLFIYEYNIRYISHTEIVKKCDIYILFSFLTVMMH